MADPAPIILYTTTNGAVRVEVMIRNETVWLTQKALAELFGINVPAVSKYLKGIFATGELTEAAVVSKMEIPAADWGLCQSRPETSTRSRARSVPA